jgi:CubicO group peptidase (beta-lactamase class C family)
MSPSRNQRPQALIREYDPEQVTSTQGGQPEVDPAEAGLSRKQADAIWRALVNTYRSRLYPAIGFTLRRRGKVVFDRAIGHARGNGPGDSADAPVVQATPATLFNLFSASKMVTAMLVHLLDERGALRVDDPVALYIPEFAQHGKQWVTIRHVLTHRSGIPNVPREYANLDILERPERIVELLCAAKPTLAPGRRLAYHALTGGYVLAEIVRRVTGKDVRAFLAEEVLEPLGFAHFNYGVPIDDRSRLAENSFTGRPVARPVRPLLTRALSVDFNDAVEMSNDPRFLSAVVPAGNIISTADEASRFMQLLLQGGELDGVRVFDSRTITRAVIEQSYLEVDLTLLAPIRYSMGFMLGSNYASLYGLRTTRLFGHMGFTNVVVYADPERDISVALMTSGKPFIAPGVLRWLGLLQRIAYSCPRDWGRGRAG